MVKEWTAGNVAAEWELARRLPWWTVWYGEHTRRFWAVPRAGHLSAAPHIEATTPQELEHAARQAERAAAERGAPPHEGTPHRGQPYGERPAGEAASSIVDGKTTPFGEAGSFGGDEAGSFGGEGEAAPFAGETRGGPPGTNPSSGTGNPPPGRTPGTS